MQKDAELHAEEDKKRREEIDARNRADQAVYQAERMLKDAGDKLSAAEKQPVEAAIEALKSALEKGDATAVNAALEALTTAQHKAAEALYRQAQTAGPGGPEAGEGAGAGAGFNPGAQQGGGQPRANDGDVIDAEVVEEDRK
jgi:molecular chaperone DnaK